MTYDFTETSELRQKVSDAIKEIVEFNSITTPRMKENAKWRIYSALTDCAGFLDRITPKEERRVVCG